jgi:hypothetical protein
MLEKDRSVNVVPEGDEKCLMGNNISVVLRSDGRYDGNNRKISVVILPRLYVQSSISRRLHPVYNF